MVHGVFDLFVLDCINKPEEQASRTRRASPKRFYFNVAIKIKSPKIKKDKTLPEKKTNKSKLKKKNR